MRCSLDVSILVIYEKCTYQLDTIYSYNGRETKKKAINQCLQLFIHKVSSGEIPQLNGHYQEIQLSASLGNRQITVGTGGSMWSQVPPCLHFRESPPHTTNHVVRPRPTNQAFQGPHRPLRPHTRVGG